MLVSLRSVFLLPPFTVSPSFRRPGSALHDSICSTHALNHFSDKVFPSVGAVLFTFVSHKARMDRTSKLFNLSFIKASPKDKLAN